MENRQLGDYRLLQSLASDASQTTWLAEQTSVSRKTLIVELHDLSLRLAFLEQVRAKAAVDHPLIASVFEAVSDDTQCFAALEFLTGASLAEHLRDRIKLPPVRLAHALRRTAEAMQQLSRTATEPLTPAAIHIDGIGSVRLENLACAGLPAADREMTDILHLGEALPTIVPENQPGAGRLLTLLAWMRGEGLSQPLDWSQVQNYAIEIENQLLASPSVVAPPVRSRTHATPWLIGIALAALLGLGGLALSRRQPTTARSPQTPSEPPVPGPVAVPAGDYLTPDGDPVSLPAYRLGACEVTIGEYLEFLDVLEALPPADRQVFDPKDQPSHKRDHLPKDWEAMLAAARGHGFWEGRSMSLNCPVVNVDGWDAAAYARWAGGRLPSQQEWFAAVESPSTLLPAPWGPVTDPQPRDLTPNGLHGMAGSVREWTREPGINPANPAAPAQPIIIGASFLRPSSGAWTRQWVADLDLHADDLGFRIVLSADTP
ncbi:hypothetical protein HNR46_001886 [Haloferula luteola]|uniref:Sulfatase-modifying factor enzyme-like domain-containing protein n=1 Tax=Haloferula luteola TaxID=595692 RepID=A0A840UZV9_9BACT|nr:SUMF1/EgtB/PvdO family nonheme iron enzyme [Haloferula luteola]MBB5351647.1 hypothetical protein [Haloferula luteola]